MNRSPLAGLAGLCLAFAGASATCRAGGQDPASFLLFPEFDNRTGNSTFLT